MNNVPELGSIKLSIVGEKHEVVIGKALPQAAPDVPSVEAPAMTASVNAVPVTFRVEDDVMVAGYKGYRIVSARRGYRVYRGTGELLPTPAVTLRAACGLVDYDLKN